MSTYRIEISVFGDERVEARLKALIARSLMWKPAFTQIEELWERTSRGWFDSRGRGSWPPLAATTRAAKSSKGLPAETLVRTSRLRDSLTRTTSDSHRHMSNDWLWFGTQVPYARFHEYGTRRMPKRPPLLPITEPRVLAETAVILRAYLVGML